MYTTTLRKVGGSMMVAVPPGFLELLQLRPGTTLGLSVEGGRLILEPKPRLRYTLDELLEASDYPRRQSVGERQWVDAAGTGDEPA